MSMVSADGGSQHSRCSLSLQLGDASALQSPVCKARIINYRIDSEKNKKGEKKSPKHQSRCIKKL